MHEKIKMTKKHNDKNEPVKTNGNKVDNTEKEEPNFSDPENFTDDITDEELLGDFLAQKPSKKDDVASIIIVDGVPKVEPKRFDKLQIVLEKIFGRYGKIINKDYPKDENETTKGYVFYEYDCPENALKAVQATNNYKLDKEHTLKVNLNSDMEKYKNIPDKWSAPEPEMFTATTDLYSFLLDSYAADCYDQFCVVQGNGSAGSVQLWVNSVPEPTLIEERNGWTQTYVKWSTQGTYLATFHKPGVALWGGSKFQRIARLNQKGAECIDFSPCENYAITYSPRGDGGGSEKRRLIMWDIISRKEKRSFYPQGVANWPIFRWSYNDKYVAYMGEDVLSIYETPCFGLLDKKSIKTPGIKDFSWSPTDNILAYWVPEDKDVPARVTLLEIPSRNELRKNNLFNVADCKIFWQKSGDYLCVKVDRFAKKKEKTEQKYTGMSYNFEIFHMREKLIPVDSIDIKETIHAFAWEPVGTKFAIIHGELPVTVSFYEVRCGLAPALLKKLEKRACNHLFWSPNGQFIVLAGLSAMTGALEFVDTNDFTVMNITDHYQVSDVEWDLTGRYVVTSVCSWKTSVDNAYWIWSFQGKILKRVNLSQLNQFLWRPRPRTPLTAEQIKEIKKNLKKYSAQFESKDRLRLTRASKELIEKRRGLMNEFEKYRQIRIAEWNKQKIRRKELRKNVDTDQLDSDVKNMEEESVEFFIKEETSIVDGK